MPVAGIPNLFYTAAMRIENAPTLTIEHPESTKEQSVVARGVLQVHALSDRGALEHRAMLEHELARCTEDLHARSAACDEALKALDGAVQDTTQRAAA